MYALIEWVIYYTLYVIAGLFLKIGDDLLDETDRPQLAWIPLALAGFAFGTLMTYNEWDMALLTAIIIGVFVSGKVNRPQFSIGFIIIGLILFFRGFPIVTDWYQWSLVVVILFLTAVVDEIGNDWVEEKGGIIAFFFGHRFTLKVTALLVVFATIDFLATAFAIWVFDLGYEAAAHLTKRMLSHGGMQDCNKHL